MIFLACQEDFSDSLFWDKSRTDIRITQPCSELHPNFRSGVNIGRWCQSDGSWSPVDVTNCTMFMESNAIVLLSFTVSSENNVLKELNITNIQNTVTQLAHKVSIVVDNILCEIILISFILAMYAHHTAGA